MQLGQMLGGLVRAAQSAADLCEGVVGSAEARIQVECRAQLLLGLFPAALASVDSAKAVPSPARCSWMISFRCRPTWMRICSISRLMKSRSDMFRSEMFKSGMFSPGMFSPHVQASLEQKANNEASR